MENWSEYLKFFAALLAIVNPMGAIPIYINLTASQNRRQRRRTSNVAALATAAILITVLFTGELLLKFFGISIASFRVGGGILILLMAISMLHAKLSDVKQTEEEAEDLEDKENIAVVPMATPLLAGPGAISTVILYAQRKSSLQHQLLLLGLIIALALLSWLILRTAPAISKLLGKTGINVVTRLMGLVMAAVGVEFIANGLRQLFPMLAG